MLPAVAAAGSLFGKGGVLILAAAIWLGSIALAAFGGYKYGGSECSLRQYKDNSILIEKNRKADEKVYLSMPRNRADAFSFMLERAIEDH